MSMKRAEMRLEQLKDWFSQAQSEILAISPYMTPSTLTECLSKVSPEVDVTVVCSWRTNDLLFGSSKIETYDLCQDNGWSLRVDLGSKRCNEARERIGLGKTLWLRRLTPVELERLNGFPDGHTDLASDGRRAFFMGNALVCGIVSMISKVITLSHTE
jgi:hypothetical protein